MKPDGIQGGGASYPGKPSCPVVKVAYWRQKTESTRKTPKRGGAEGGRFTGSTKDSGPMKPGNSVEEKTLTIRKGEINTLGLAVLSTSSRQGKP